MIVCAVYALLGNSFCHYNDHTIVQEHTNNVFQKFDRLHQGYITMDDFVKLCLQVIYFIKTKI